MSRTVTFAVSILGDTILRRFALAIACVAAVLLPSVQAAANTSTASATLKISTHHVPLTGGSVTLTAKVTGGQTCQFFSAPSISTVDNKLACHSGKVIRRFKIGKTGGLRSFAFTLLVTSPSGLVTSKTLTLSQGSISSPGLRTVLDQSGTGEATTNDFFIPQSSDNWVVDWSYACPSVFNGFTYFVMNGNTVDVNDNGVDDLNQSGSNADGFGDGGTFHLQIVTNCSWRVSVNYLPATPSTPSPVSAQVATSAPSVTQSGGPVTVTAKVRRATWCTFISSPDIPGIDGRVRCSNGTVSRQGEVPPSATPQSIQIEVIATGKSTLATSSVSVVERNPQVLLTDSGSTTIFGQASPSFTIPSSDTQWSINWSYTCGTASYGPVIGFLDFSATGSTAGDSYSTPIGNGTSGTETFSDTGTFSLDISATCSWTISVMG